MELVHDAHANREEMIPDVTIGSSVSNDYVHYVKIALPGEPIVIGDTTLKWYSIASIDDPIPTTIEDQAREFVGNLHRDELTDLGAIGFVILHRCGSEFYFLLLQTWRNNNELFESVYARRSDAEPEFEEFTPGGIHHATFCVWEMAAVTHEVQAWRRFLLSSRDNSDRSRYLEDRFSGEC